MNKDRALPAALTLAALAGALQPERGERRGWTTGDGKRPPSIPKTERDARRKAAKRAKKSRKANR